MMARRTGGFVLGALLLAGAGLAGTGALPLEGGVQERPEAAPGADDEAAAERPAAERNPVDIREWKVPWPDTRPRDPYVRDRSRVWFVGQRGNYLAYLQPGSGEFEQYELDPGTGPHNLIVDSDGMVWYAGNRAAHIGRLDPATGEITKFPMPDERARDPHTLVFDEAGDIWFTVQGGNFVGKLDRGAGDVRLVEVPTERARPYGIKVSDAGRPWIALLGTNKLATVNPETFELTEYELPRADANPRRLGIASDGTVWYVDYSQGYVGRFDPETEAFEEWRAPSGGEARPYGMAMDGQDRVWFVETGPSPNRFVGFAPEAEEFFSVTEIPSGGGTIRHMYHHAPEGEIWFGTDTNTIGRAAVP